jgi:Delta7-sterol 5-desaturase
VQPTTYFLNETFWNAPTLVIPFAVTIFLIVFGRYLLLSLGYHKVMMQLYRTSARRFYRSTAGQWRKEILWAALSTLVFTILSLGTYWLYQQGVTKIYINIDEHPMWYFAASIFILLIGYETYYYWLHRWMHRPSVFRHVHKVHHESIHTSVFTSFSFHPIEALLQFIFLPLALLIIPVHYYALGIVLILMTASAIVNHSGVEIFPRGFEEHKIGRWLIGATHHDLHHKEFKTNFGLYLTIWDKWMKTESNNFKSRFRERTTDSAQDVSRSQ